jgi:hypothetical protein
MSESHEEKMIFDAGIILVFVMIMLFMGFEAFKSKYKLSFGHEASFVTLIGFLISWFFIKDATNYTFADMMSFN